MCPSIRNNDAMTATNHIHPARVRRCAPDSVDRARVVVGSAVERESEVIIAG